MIGRGAARSRPSTSAPGRISCGFALPPEGELDLRLNRLIDKVFFEGQVKYDFVDGDITAFLRYRCYGYRRTYQLSVFDAIEFEGVESLSEEFERVRGALFISQWPQDFHHRAFLTGSPSAKAASQNPAGRGESPATSSIVWEAEMA